MKVIIGAFAHESNDFCPNFTTREMFEFYEGSDVIDTLPVSDIFTEAGIEIIPAIYANAQAYGVVAEDAYLYFEEKILDVVRRNPDTDGIWLFCHGAMNVENIGSGEYRLACDMRNIVGPNCVISFGMDLHGNMEADIANKVNILRCYHTAPHIDVADTFRRTAQALVDYLQSGYKCFTQLRKLPMILPGEMAATTVEPFKGIVSVMKEWEENDPAVACASTYIGFAWTDAPRTSSAVAVVPSAPEYEDYCSKKADELAELVFSKRAEFDFETLALRPPETVNTSLYELPAPVCVTDMGDNPIAGTTGGSTILLREYLEAGGSGKRVLIAGIFDKKAFDICKARNAGDIFELSIGIDIDEVTRPVTIVVTYRGCHDIYSHITDGDPLIKRFEGVMVSAGSIDIIITDQAAAFIYEANFTSCGIDTSRYDVFVTKFGYIYPELKKLANSYIMSNTPGESYQMVAEFDYKHIKRPIFPMDLI